MQSTTRMWALVRQYPTAPRLQRQVEVPHLTVNHSGGVGSPTIGDAAKAYDQLDVRRCCRSCVVMGIARALGAM